jgi:hypothetical protein
MRQAPLSRRVVVCVVVRLAIQFALVFSAPRFVAGSRLFREDEFGLMRKVVGWTTLFGSVAFFISGIYVTWRFVTGR